ncbi:hypothetical protein MTO96_033828 [Rhipicephalus appendiculatus]
MLLHGRLGPFEGPPDQSTRRRFTCFSAHTARPRRNSRAISLASCGTQVFSLLLHPLKPATPHTKTLSELLTTLLSHFSPASSTLMERFRFNNRTSRKGKSLG